MLHVSSSDALLEAAIHDKLSDSWALVHASEFTPDDSRHEAFCPHCLEAGYATKVRKADKDSKPNPSGWNIHAPGHGNSFLDRFIPYPGVRHLCDHPVSSLSLRQLGFRYGDKPVDDSDISAREFPVDISDKTSHLIRPNFIHTSQRLSKVAKALLKNPNLRAKQRLTIDGLSRPFHDAVFCYSDSGRIFRQALERARAGGQSDISIGMIFRPIGHQGMINAAPFRLNNAIPGMALSAKDDRVTIDGEDLRPSVVLVCKNSRIYEHVRKMMDTDTHKSIPLFVFGRLRVSPENLDKQIKRLKAGEEVPRAAYTRLYIDTYAHVTPWTSLRQTEFLRTMPKADKKLQAIAATIK